MIKINDVFNYKFISGLSLSPKKEKIGFVVYQGDLEENRYHARFNFYNRNKKELVESIKNKQIEQFKWIDEQTIVIFKKEEWENEGALLEGTVFSKLNVESGEESTWCRVPYLVKSFECLENGDLIILSSYDGQEDKSEEAIIIDEIPFWSDGQGITNKIRNRMYRWHSKTDEVTPITDELTNVNFMTLHKNEVLFVAKRFTDKSNLVPGAYAYDSQTGNTKTLLPENLYRIEYLNYIGGKPFFIGADSKTALATDNPKFYFIENEQAKLWIDTDFSCRDTVGSDCRYGENQTFRVEGDVLYLVSTHERSSFIKKISLDGTIEILTKDDGSIDGFDVAEDEIVFTGLRGTKLMEIYSQKNGVENQLTEINQQALVGKDISTPEPMVFENNGYNVHYVVLKPARFDENKKYPAVLYIHGGAKVIYGTAFFHEMQMLANQGYFVIYGNPRGSDGQGSEFARLQGQYGIPDYSDMMKAVDTAMERYPQIDEEKLGVMGGSYGGIMTNWIIGHTNRFKCAISQRSLCNMVSSFGTADNGFNFVAEQMNSTPWKNHELLWQQSPLKYADKVETPALFIHPQEDYRCHYSESLQMFTALKYHGVDSRVCIIKGESHGLSRSGRPKSRVKRLEEIVNWLAKYLGGEAC